MCGYTLVVTGAIKAAQGAANALADKVLVVPKSQVQSLPQSPSGAERPSLHRRSWVSREATELILLAKK
jgi:hypothetical protein